MNPAGWHLPRQSAFLAVVAAALATVVLAAPGATDLDGRAATPLRVGKISVLIFVRTDCPISNRYAPEIQRLSKAYRLRGVEFWLVYPNPDETAGGIRRHAADYGYDLGLLRDPTHDLVQRSQVTITPEAAVFSGERLVYHGRIDDRYPDLGKARRTTGAHDLEDALESVLAGRPVRTAVTRAVGCSIADLR